jgi:hypothetical protein
MRSRYCNRRRGAFGYSLSSNFDGVHVVTTSCMEQTGIGDMRIASPMPGLQI